MILYLVLVFIFGSAVGSFLNVVIDRAVNGGSIMGRSHCDWCRATLSTVDLVPIISFVGLGAKCRRCHKKLSWQYPLVEGLTATLFTISFWVIVSSGNLDFIKLGFWLLLISVLVVVFVVDFRFSLIPTTFVYAISLVALFFVYFASTPTVFIDHVIAALGACLFFLLIVLVTFGRGMGQGDVVLAFLIGLVLGVKVTVLAMFLAFLSGAMVSILLLALGRKKFGNTIPFGPFLVFGFMVALFWGESILTYYFKMLY